MVRARIPPDLVAFVGALLAAACGGAPERGVDNRRDAVIVGADDRVEVYEAPSATAIAARSVGALFHAHHLQFEASGAGRLLAPTAGEGLGLCAGERFAEQPIAAYCSGVLISETLLATAGHCLGSDLTEATRRCQEIRVAFGYELDGPGAIPALLPAEDIFACRAVVALERDTADFAVLELDRPQNSNRPWARAAHGRPQPSDALTVISNGVGLPLKVDLGASVSDAPEKGAFFGASSDTFAGGSGGGLFDEKLELVGLVNGGVADWEAADDCTRAAHVEVSSERHLYFDVVLAALGDLPAYDALPTAKRSCGDGVCEIEERASCEPDCHHYDAVPASWLGDPETGQQAFATTTPSESSAGASPGCTFAMRAASGTRTVTPFATLIALFSWLRARRRNHA